MLNFSIQLFQVYWRILGHWQAKHNPCVLHSCSQFSKVIITRSVVTVFVLYMDVKWTFQCPLWLPVPTARSFQHRQFSSLNWSFTSDWSREQCRWLKVSAHGHPRPKYSSALVHKLILPMILVATQLQAACRPRTNSATTACASTISQQGQRYRRTQPKTPDTSTQCSDTALPCPVSSKASYPGWRSFQGREAQASHAAGGRTARMFGNHYFCASNGPSGVISQSWSLN